VVPIWFLHEEGRIWFTPRQASEWLTHIRRDPRVALCIDEQNPPWRKVVVRGRAEIVHELGEDDAWRERYRAIARRYIPPEAADAYVDATDDQPRALLAVSLSHSELRCWRMPVQGEPYRSIWADRYYTPDAKIRKLDPSDIAV
jgi:nitroimidazol reductase NimA-like FMN-containing flavoprotein (pyridoxamine 5'-phosphate oxidase superfamily)